MQDSPGVAGEPLCPKDYLNKDKGNIFDMLAFMLVPLWFAVSQKVIFIGRTVEQFSDSVCISGW